MLVLRSLVYNFLFFATCIIMSVVLLPLLVAPRRFLQSALRIWAALLMWQLKVVVGLDWEIRGLENLPKGPAIIAAKHQSAWDTGVFHQFLDDPVFVLKQELTWIPLFGWLITKAGAISIDRSAGAKALKGMVRATDQALAKGRSVLIFPEGTRTAPGFSKPYNPGVAAIYKNAGVPVVPVALNSGLFWQRRSFLKRPGRITLELLPVIEAGLDRKTFMAELEARIEGACRRLAIEGRAKYPSALPAPDGDPQS